MCNVYQDYVLRTGKAVEMLVFIYIMAIPISYRALLRDFLQCDVVPEYSNSFTAGFSQVF